MTDDQRVRVQSALNALNAAMADIKATDGDATRVYPGTRFNDADGVSEIYIEITTGREILTAADR